MTHELPFRRCTAADLFKRTDGPDTNAAEIDAFLAECDEYLGQFVAPVTKDGATLCFHCGSTMDGMRHALGIGAAYVWAIVHGEANCSHCGWPARGMHYPKGKDGEQLFGMRNTFLAYHPDLVEKKEEA